MIQERAGENYKVNIGTSSLANLSLVAFDGATQRNRPDLKTGDIVYCRVLESDKHMETEITCCSINKKKDWVTGQTLYGQLVDGYLIQVSLNLCRK
jgi:exosome complex component RRP40